MGIVWDIDVSAARRDTVERIGTLILNFGERAGFTSTAILVYGWIDGLVQTAPPGPRPLTRTR